MSTPAGRRSAVYLLGLSTLVLAASLLGGAMLILQPETGGFFSGLSNVLGLLLIGVGNLVSWVVHLFCWYVHRMRWLGIVLLIQSVPAIFVAGWLATMGVDAYQEN